MYSRRNDNIVKLLLFYGHYTGQAMFVVYYDLCGKSKYLCNFCVFKILYTHLYTVIHNYGNP